MTDRSLRVASYNIHGCVGMDRRYAPKRVLGVLAELESDVIGLQEVDTRRPTVAKQHQFDYLCRETGFHGVAGANIRGAGGDYGNALLTCWPVLDVRRCNLTIHRREPRGALDVDLKTPQGLLRIIVTHLGLGWRERRLQIERLLMELEPLVDRPTLLMGDFNDWLPRGGLHIRALARYFAAGFGGRSYPARWPLLELDRIYAHPRPLRAKSWIHSSRLARCASDHLPVVAELAWHGGTLEKDAQPATI